jgi:hypothetical protein
MKPKSQLVLLGKPHNQLRDTSWNGMKLSTLYIVQCTMIFLGNHHLVGSLMMNTTLEYSTRVVQEAEFKRPLLREVQKSGLSQVY